MRVPCPHCNETGDEPADTTGTNGNGHALADPATGPAPAAPIYGTWTPAPPPPPPVNRRAERRADWAFLGLAVLLVLFMASGIIFWWMHATAASINVQQSQSQQQEQNQSQEQTQTVINATQTAVQTKTPPAQRTPQPVIPPAPTHPGVAPTATQPVVAATVPPQATATQAGVAPPATSPAPTATTPPAPTATPAPQPRLGVSPASLHLTLCVAGTDSFTVRNDGTGTLNWSASSSNGLYGFSPKSGSLGPGDAQPVQVNDITLSGTITVSGNGGSASIPVTCG